MFWNKYPYTDFHELNLDWILARMMELHKEWDEFTAVNKITNAGAWDITKQYQAWTIVSDNNAGYISLQPVPAGVAISNTEYWGLIADYNIMITDLTTRIIALENNQGNLSGLHTTDKSNLVNAINENTDSINLLTKRRYIFIGDSYGTQPSADSSWIAVTMKALGLTLGSDAFRVSANSYGFIGGAGAPPGDYDWLSLLTSASGVITHHDTITDIVVMGGTNDYLFTDSDIQDAVDAFVAYCTSEYPNAIIHIGMCSNVQDDDWYDVAFRIREDYAYAAANYANCRYINNIENALRGTTAMQADNIHPAINGSYLLGVSLSRYLKTGYGSTDYINPANPEGWTALTIASYGAGTAFNVDFYGRKVNDKIEVCTINNQMTLGTTITCNGTPVKLCTFDRSPLIGAAVNDTMCTGIFTERNLGLCIPCTFYIKDRELYVAMIAFSGGSPVSIPTGPTFISFKMIVSASFN